MEFSLEFVSRPWRHVQRTINTITGLTAASTQFIIEAAQTKRRYPGGSDSS